MNTTSTSTLTRYATLMNDYHTHVTAWRVCLQSIATAWTQRVQHEVRRENTQKHAQDVAWAACLSMHAYEAATHFGPTTYSMAMNDAFTAAWTSDKDFANGVEAAFRRQEVKVCRLDKWNMWGMLHPPVLYTLTNGTLRIAFRGTVSTNLADCIIDCISDRTQEVWPDTGVFVHRGFWLRFAGTKPCIDKLLSDHQAKVKRVVFSGHSLGGAVANVATLHYKFYFRGKAMGQTKEELLVSQRKRHLKPSPSLYDLPLQASNVVAYTFGAPHVCGFLPSVLVRKYAWEADFFAIVHEHDPVVKALGSCFIEEFQSILHRFTSKEKEVRPACACACACLPTHKRCQQYAQPPPSRVLTSACTCVCARVLDRPPSLTSMPSLTRVQSRYYNCPKCYMACCRGQPMRLRRRKYSTNSPMTSHGMRHWARIM